MNGFLEGKFGHRQAEREDDYVKREAQVGGMPGNVWGHQKLEEARKDPVLRLWRECGPVSACFQTFGIQNCERINLWF